MTKQSVTVDLDDRSYDILIDEGLIENAGPILSPHLSSGRAAIISDETVWGLYGKMFEASLKGSGIDCVSIIRPSGEAQKSFESLQKVLSSLLDAGLDRKDTVIALGGGVIGDLAGFVASIYKRGCQFIQVPTTLLAQVDSSVGGKTAINVPQGKNLVGAFYQPRLVMADMSVLKSLPDREVKAGYAEVLKYGLLGDKVFFNWLEENGRDVLSLNPRALAKAVAQSCKAKARIVEMDEKEQGARALLNLGHTFGHALEAEAGYDGDLLHGEAVSAGMEMAFEFSVNAGLCDPSQSQLLNKHLKRLNMPVIRDMKRLTGHPDHLLKHMRQDKKNDGDGIALILAREIGEAFIQRATSEASIMSYLESLA